ncbi:MAG: DUF490 domain-containing protein [Burkholderiaceae bacterium]|nr:MAG: DUF490 domain-containing protein [Burkholderiaceae bacterium]TAM00905.1 MAG: DUF490 domain-containing protein [Pusillimonas sp.]
MLLWLGPALVLALAVVCGFIVWCVGTEPGTRWMLHTAVRQVQGEVRGIQGTVWNGLRVQNLSVKLPEVAIELDDLNLKVDWRELTQRRLHVREISAARLAITVTQSGQTSQAPFSVPALPVRVALDHVAVGELSVTTDGQPLPVGVRNLQAAFSLSGQNASLALQGVDLAHADITASVEGNVDVSELADPWPLSARLQARVQTSRASSPLCVHNFLPALPSAAPATTAGACAADVAVNLSGSLDAMSLKVDGGGQGLDLVFNANLLPRKSLPVSNGDLALRLADGSTLKADLSVDASPNEGSGRDHVVGWVSADRLNLGRLVGSAIPQAMLTGKLELDAWLQDYTNLLSAKVGLQVAAGSSWNRQPVSGHVRANIAVQDGATPAQAPAAAGAAQASAVQMAAPQVPPPVWQRLRLSGLDIDMHVGRDRVSGKGALGAPGSQLALDVAVARLADLWPGLQGAVRAQVQLGGTLSKHDAKINAVYSPGAAKAQGIGQGPFDVRLDADGGWAADRAGVGEWKGRVLALSVSHAGLGMQLQAPVAVSYAPQAPAPAWQWQVGATTLAVQLPLNQSVVVRHLGSRGRAGAWETQGAIDHLTTSRRLLREVQKTLGLAQSSADARGRVVVASDKRNDQQQIDYAVDWNMKFLGALEGRAHIRRLSGDLIVPGNPDVPLGLQALNVNINAKPVGASLSRLTADVRVVTAKMGQGTVTASAMLRSTPGGGFVLDRKDPQTVDVDAEIKDLGWLSLFTGDAMDLGGSVRANLKARSKPDGTWTTSGTVRGENIRIVRVDDGVRLLNGTLSAHFDGDRFVLDSLRFPARLRVTPKEWRTAEWVSSNPDARDGSLTLTGQWSLESSTGAVDIDLYRYPLLQRSDRYAMVTGKLHASASASGVALSGKITADAGWVDLDMLSSVPTLDSDVVVLRNGKAPAASAPVNVSMDLDIDLGPRFYITGYGVDSGLVGDMHLSMHEGALTAMGALRTRGGAIDIYGQHLQLRRGTITFQGSATDPVLNIEALRTGLSVEAGVRVAGTAKRPRIDLVSYPDVSDVQKLSWLLLGRGPDDSGGDAALLFSVGTSFLTDGEPFYRKFGLDDVAMQSGTLGSTGSILPVETVVRGLDTGTSDIERRFVTASKNLSKGFTVSVQQALSDTGTVGRLSYRLARGLSADLSVGTVNGIALIYRTIFRD